MIPPFLCRNLSPLLSSYIFPFNDKIPTSVPMSSFLIPLYSNLSPILKMSSQLPVFQSKSFIFPVPDSLTYNTTGIAIKKLEVVLLLN
jgi:hypothetical protein